MRVVALISGGKDSCYNMMQCVAAGHQIVALANLRPAENTGQTDELDSYMYQTVGHHAIDLYADALDLPLYRGFIKGTSVNTGRVYTACQEDEVEDLYHLMKLVKCWETQDDSPVLDHGSQKVILTADDCKPANFIVTNPDDRYLYSCKEIILRRNTSGSLGFSIVGGYEEHTGNKPFFIKSIVGGTPAYNDGRIRCGDILLAVNGRNTSGMTHACLARMLKELKGKITLTVVSWPGTFL